MIIFPCKEAAGRSQTMGKEVGCLKYFVGDVRYAKGMSLRELSDRARISKSYLQRIEAGEATPSLEVMVRIARALGVPLDDLYQAE